MQCPDCNSGLKPGATKCRCGWSMPLPQTRPAPSGIEGPVRSCSTVGCGKPAAIRVDERWLCRACETAERQARVEEHMRELGLETVEQKRAYCMRLAKKFGREARFDVWAKNIRQGTVDMLVRMGGPNDLKALERLRDAGAIDERFQLVPLEEREAIRQARAEERRRAELELIERGVISVSRETEEVKPRE